MRWSTQVEYIAAKINSEELIQENITITIEDKDSNSSEFNAKQSLKFQLLAWKEARKIKPEWIPENHRTGLVILPASPDFQFQHVKLSHEYAVEA